MLLLPIPPCLLQSFLFFLEDDACLFSELQLLVPSSLLLVVSEATPTEIQNTDDFGSTANHAAVFAALSKSLLLVERRSNVGAQAGPGKVHLCSPEPNSAGNHCKALDSSAPAHSAQPVRGELATAASGQE